MPIMYVSSAGSNTAPYDTWAKAATTLLVATAAQVSDNDIYTLNTHSESPAVATVYLLAEGVAVYSVNSSDVYTPGATISATGNITVRGDMSDVKGFNFTTTGNFIVGYIGETNSIEDSTINLVGALSAQLFALSSDGGVSNLKNIEVNFSLSSQSFSCGNGGKINIDGLTSTGVKISEFTNAPGNGGTRYYISNSDLDSLMIDGSRLVAVFVSGDDLVDIELYRCKLPPNLTDFTILSINNYRIAYISCDNGNGYHYFYLHIFEGTPQEDTDNYLSATYDGTNGFSALLSTSADASIGNPLRNRLLVLGAADITSDMTIRVNLLTDNIQLNDTNCWLEFVKPDNTSQALGVVQSTRNTDILDSTPVNLSEDVTNTWTSPGVVTDLEMYIEDTISALSNVDNGVVEVWLCLAEPSTDLWACPDLVIT